MSGCWLPCCHSFAPSTRSFCNATTTPVLYALPLSALCTVQRVGKAVSGARAGHPLCLLLEDSSRSLTSDKTFIKLDLLLNQSSLSFSRERKGERLANGHYCTLHTLPGTSSKSVECDRTVRVY